MRVSVVINTVDRAASLRTTLGSLKYQTYPEFEVIVVNGPSTDDTESVLSEFSGEVRLASCSERNLSKSRNVGIKTASGDIVAFIDDDAIPEPRWLEELVAGYDSEKIGGVGGVVYDYTGFRFQDACCVADRRGNQQLDIRGPLWAYEIPNGASFIHLIGTNASFRRGCLEEIGGFDEEIEYYLDETLVCMRIIDRGYWLRRVRGAPVHHKFLPSKLRNDFKVLRKPYPVIKNKIYYCLLAKAPEESVEEIVEDCRGFAERLRDEAKWHHDAGRLDASELRAFEEDLVRGFERGTKVGTEPISKPVSFPPVEPRKFSHFPIVSPEPRQLTICFVSQDLPAERPGGIARFTYDLAAGFAALGHDIHLITRSPDHDRVDFEDGIWVHRLKQQSGEGWNDSDLSPTVRKNLSHAASVHREVRRIAKSHAIDLVSVPIWDTEGLYCLLDDSLTTVLSLQTSVKTVIDMHPSWQSAETAQLVSLERCAVEAAKYVHSISADILSKVRRDYQAPTDAVDAFVVPLGIVDHADDYPAKTRDGKLRVLSVGRLEKRKGVDLLLEAAATLATEHPNLEFVFVGDDTIPNEAGQTYRAAFEERHVGEPILNQVRFTGLLSEDDMYQHYADCDIFCLPARYESFGLVLVEAMMFGKPVVGFDVGGMKEIIEHGRNGFLTKREDASALAADLKRLVMSQSLREKFGRKSRRIYEEKFSAEAMVRETLNAYTRIIYGDGP